ncbi:hypothetical protein D3C81_2015050 [compost metagenome]
MQKRPGHERMVAFISAQLTRQFGIAGASGIAHPPQKATCMSHADLGDQLAAERGEGRQLHEEGALLAEPDLALVGLHPELAGQILGEVTYAHSDSHICYSAP